MDREELKKRVEKEMGPALARFRALGDWGAEAWVEAVIRPLVERIVELEVDGTQLLKGRTMAENTIVTIRAELEAERMARLAAQDALAYAGSTVRSLEGANAKARQRIDALELEAAEHDRTTAALRSQIAALEAVANGQEEALRDAVADARAEGAAELLSTRTSLERAMMRVVSLETTVGEIARLTGRRVS